ncbi:MAG: aminopeptidase P family protein [Beijerinckiaceae bacterium]
MGNSIFQSFDTKSEPKLSAERLSHLRAELKARDLDGYIIPRADQYQNEYLPDCEERVGWLTGFTGSAGFCIVLQDEAAVFSDGRYTEQMKAQLDPAAFSPVSITDHPPAQWLKGKTRAGQRIGYDPDRHTPDSLRAFEAAAAIAGFVLVSSTPNPVDAVWRERPAQPATPVSLHPLRFAGVEASTKLGHLVHWLKAERRDALVVTDQPSLAWLFNIRGRDVLHMPLALGLAILRAEGRSTLYIDGRKLSDAVRQALSAIADVEEERDFATALAAQGAAGLHAAFDKATASIGMINTFKVAGGKADVRDNPITGLKAAKNDAERRGARSAQLRDGAAVANFLRWLDIHAPKGGITEIDAATQMEGFRAATGKLKDISFDTISAAGPHAALPHYRVNRDSNREITAGLFLIDSGGQYEDGTTDITRVIAIGRPTPEMKDRFTRVLKGMIAISRAVFPKGTSGAQLDTLGRQALWDAGLDFDHGVGHGVGSYLGVHEGPQGISKVRTAPLEPGMIVSNEPGYYKPGAYGIRIENLVMVEERKVKGAERPMLGFETLTLCPIDRRLIAVALLTDSERSWLDTYHARVLKALLPRVSPVARTWLKRACQPI